MKCYVTFCLISYKQRRQITLSSSSRESNKDGNNIITFHNIDVVADEKGEYNFDEDIAIVAILDAECIFVVSTVVDEDNNNDTMDDKYDDNDIDCSDIS